MLPGTRPGTVADCHPTIGAAQAFHSLTQSSPPTTSTIPATTSRFAHLAHLPMFGVVMGKSSHRWSVSIAGADLAPSDISSVVVTRWAAQPAETAPRPLLVDILEVRPRSSWKGQVIIVRANQPVTLRVRGEWTVRLREAGDAWSRTTMAPGTVDDVVVVAAGTGENRISGLFSWTRKTEPSPVATTAVDMEMVVRQERPVATTECHTMEKRFERLWSVPVL